MPEEMKYCLGFESRKETHPANLYLAKSLLMNTPNIQEPRKHITLSILKIVIWRHVSAAPKSKQ
jgi:hypothetical protein